MAVRTHAVPLDDAALAWLALALVPELLPRRAFALVERFGTPRAVLDAPAGALAAADVPPAAVASLGTAAGRARRDAEARQGGRHAGGLERRRVSARAAPHRPA